MTNAELIKALRRCSYMTVADELNEDYCKPCAYYTEDSADVTCIDRMMIDAADALEKCMKKENDLRTLIDGRGDPVSSNVDAILKGEYE